MLHVNGGGSQTAVPAVQRALPGPHVPTAVPAQLFPARTAGRVVPGADTPAAVLCGSPGQQQRVVALQPLNLAAHAAVPTFGAACDTRGLNSLYSGQCSIPGAPLSVVTSGGSRTSATRAHYQATAAAAGLGPHCSWVTHITNTISNNRFSSSNTVHDEHEVFAAETVHNTASGVAGVCPPRLSRLVRDIYACGVATESSQHVIPRREHTSSATTSRVGGSPGGGGPVVVASGRVTPRAMGADDGSSLSRRGRRRPPSRGGARASRGRGRRSAESRSGRHTVTFSSQAQQMSRAPGHAHPGAGAGGEGGAPVDTSAIDRLESDDDHFDTDSPGSSFTHSGGCGVPLNVRVPSTEARRGGGGGGG